MLSPEGLTQTQSISFKSLVTYHIIKHYNGHYLSLNILTLNSGYYYHLMASLFTIYLHIQNPTVNITPVLLSAGAPEYRIVPKYH